MSQKKIYRCNQQQNVLWLRAAVGRDGDRPIVVRLLIDTGASYSVLPIPILQSIGCNLDSSFGKKKIVTANGAISVPIISHNLTLCTVCQSPLGSR